jgi:hypothetical protein
MSKSEVLNNLAETLENPGSMKSGEYLEEQVRQQLERALLVDRLGVIEALNDWVLLREEPQTMLAVQMAVNFRLYELLNPIKVLGEDIAAGRIFFPFYKQWVDEAIKALSYEH